MTNIITFDAALKESEDKDRALLTGNGFSIKHFSYSTLLDKSGLDGPLRALFNTLNTVDFEFVIKALEDAAVVEKTYHKDKRAALFLSEADKVRRARTCHQADSSRASCRHQGCHSKVCGISIPLRHDFYLKLRPAPLLGHPGR